MEQDRRQGDLNAILGDLKSLHNLSVSELVERALLRGEGRLTSTGALAVETGKYTGRSPRDKFVVRDRSTEHKVEWGEANQPMEPEAFQKLLAKVTRYLQHKAEVFVFRGFAGADKAYQLPIQVINEYAWQNLFAHQLFIRPTEAELSDHVPAFTVIAAPGFKADPMIDKTNSEAFVIISFSQRIVLIGGTEYAGEIKKSIFTVMNYLLPEEGVLSMHCSANVDKDDPNNVAIFFGLSGTGKTTLSADPDRLLIGDDEHGWSPEGLFNVEGGCYAKCVRLSKEREPEIWNAIAFGSVLENVIVERSTRIADYDDISLTENTRVAYPLTYIPNSVQPSMGGHPTTIIFLTADAFGVLPPISKLNPEQAMYHFLSGYTSKLAGTERGIQSPEATFSACFGAPFLPLHPTTYAKMLGEKIASHHVRVFLINTGWSGGSYGVGERIRLPYTRAIVKAALSGALDSIETVVDPIFGLRIPVECPGVPSEILQPKNTWANPKNYEEKAQQLARAFQENFTLFGDAVASLAASGPRLS